jgi:hypothetical protein
MQEEFCQGEREVLRRFLGIAKTGVALFEFCIIL